MSIKNIADIFFNQKPRYLVIYYFLNILIKSFFEQEIIKEGPLLFPSMLLRNTIGTCDRKIADGGSRSRARR
jgi:hypothetical protein